MKTLSFGSRGQEVTNLQEALNYHLLQAIPALVVDGILGPKTQSRLREFQAVRGLAVDGIAGPKTHRALYSFVRSRNHVIIPPAQNSSRGFVAGERGVGFTDPVLPPVPNLILPFPVPFRPPPPPLLPLPELSLGNTTQFELSAGVERTFARSLTGQTAERTTSIFSDVSFSIWRRPVSKHVDLEFGPGVYFERDVGADPRSSIRVGVFAKAELKDVLTIGPLDLFKLIIEHKTTTTATGPIELTTDIEVGFNPTVETRVLGTKIEFGPKVSKFFELGIERQGFTVKSGTTLTAGTLTVFF